MTQNDKFHNHPLASDFVVNFYLDNRSLLLDSSMSRTQLSMEHRKLLLKRLTDECRGVYGVHSDQGKIKYHFDNRKARVYKKGHEYKQKMNQSGLSVTEAFKNETDRRLWNYLSNPQKEEYPLTHRFHNAIKEATVSSNLTTDDMDSGGNLLESLLRNGTRLCYEPRQGKDESKLENKLILPSPVSDYVIEYFLKNQNALLENTNSRSNLNILERKQKMGHLTTDILRRFGIATDAHKLKSHFDNKKSRVMRKGLDYVEMVRRGNISNIVVEMFDSELDFKLWRHFQDSQPRDRNIWTVGAELLSKEIKVEAPEIIEGEPPNMDTILRHEDEQYSNTTRKRKRESRETEPFVPRPITEDEFRAKQYELMEKQIDFFNKNMELVTSMSSAVSLLLDKIAGLNTPL